MAGRSRVESIDVLRGIVMILMALDHVRDFFGAAGNPANPATASTALFFTRWITHLCAPTFFALTGAGAFLARRSRSTSELSRYLLTRGLWLIVLELTVLRCFGYQFNIDYRLTLLIILWALGWAMIALAALVHLPVRAVGWFGVLMIATHNLLDPVRASALGAFAPLWSILHAPNVVVSSPRFVVFAAYPLVPWIGVTAAGYTFGSVFEWDPARRRAFLLRIGVGFLAAFVALRAINIYGDPVRWTTQTSATRTILSFLNATKYPPSLLYLLMTLGAAALILRSLDRGTPRLLQPAHTLGTVPLFYFILHLPLIHLLAVIVCFFRYGTAHWMFESTTLNQFPVTFPPGWGYSLPIVYVLWMVVVVLLYPFCRWYAAFKRRHDNAWLQYV
jgi:uncharacterized membrane protein